MPATLGHPVFQAPENPDVAIWRYMDFTKFIALLDTQSLFFCRADLFDDPYEGATSHANAVMRPDVYADSELPEHTFRAISSHMIWARQWTFLSCWHLNDVESAAMWKLYAQAKEAIAVKSSYARLCECLPEAAYVGSVRYIDYHADWLPEGNMFYPFVHKRKSFEHERELRALIQELPTKDGQLLTGVPNPQAGLSVPVDLDMLVDGIFLSPTAPGWLTKLVTRVCARYGVKADVARSSLATEPIF